MFHLQLRVVPLRSFLLQLLRARDGSSLSEGMGSLQFANDVTVTCPSSSSWAPPTPMAILPAISSSLLRTHSVLRLRAWGPLPPPIWTQSLEPLSFLPTNPLRSDCPPHFHGCCSSSSGPPFFKVSPLLPHSCGLIPKQPAALQSLPSASLLIFTGLPAPPSTLPLCLPPHS